MSAPHADVPAPLPAAAQGALSRLQLWSLGVGAVVSVACAVGAFFDPAQFFRAYLVSFLFYFSIGHGCFALLMTYYLTGGAWGYLIRRPLEAGMKTLPLLAVLFIPLALGVEYLYPWARPVTASDSEAWRHRAFYLNVPFFCIRAAICFAIWIVIAGLLAFWSRRQDETGDPRYSRRLVLLSAPGLVLFGITIMFAAVDWLMSLQPSFHSSIIGPLLASGELLLGFGFTLIVTAWLVVRPPLAARASVEALGDLGNLLFTFLILWAYMAFFQFMLIWIADLPADVIWYVPRTRGPWVWVTWVLFFLHFVVPLFVLLMRRATQSPRTLAAMAGLLVAMHLLYLYQLVMPIFPDTGLAEHWMDFVLPLGPGGLWLAFYLWNLQRRPLLALHDRAVATAVHFRLLDEERVSEEGLQHG